MMNHELNLYTSGEKTGELVVYLHGGGLGGRMWQPVMDRMTGFYNIAPDLPDHGKSRAIPFVLRDCAERIVDLIQHESPSGKAHLVGLSLGGAVALEVMNLAPEVLNRVILSGTSLKLNNWLIRVQALNVSVLRSLPTRHLVRLMQMQFGIPNKYLSLVEEDIAVFTPEAFGRMNAAYRDIRLPVNCQLETLVVVGEKETFAAKDMARKISAGLPKGKGLIIPGVGHAWNLQEPDVFAAVATDWLEGRPLDTSRPG